ncbi:MAG: acyl-CoA thioesterase [Deltaproteobacteria bacterium]|nr:acyl-CoA thioesterase [Deltaproteobacteria bacterium]
MGKFYEYKTIVTIADTNLYHHMDFRNYFDLQGIVRGLWVKDAVVNGIDSMMNSIFLITKSAHCDFIKDFYLFDEILVRMQIKNIKHVSTEIVFHYFHNQTMELHAKGYQKIVFADRNHKICRIPENFKKAGMEFLMDP